MTFTSLKSSKSNISLDFPAMMRSYRDKSRSEERDCGFRSSSQEECFCLLGFVFSSYSNREFLQLPTQLAQCLLCVVTWVGVLFDMVMWKKQSLSGQSYEIGMFHEHILTPPCPSVCLSYPPLFWRLWVLLPGLNQGMLTLNKNAESCHSESFGRSEKRLILHRVRTLEGDASRKESHNIWAIGRTVIVFIRHLRIPLLAFSMTV